jgi:hypothetical protein
MKTIKLLRFSLIFTALLTLLAAMWAGLIRMGWSLPPLAVSLPMLHGALTVNGFLGIVIGLERAVALSAPGLRHQVLWPYLSPLCVAIGIPVLFFSAQAGVFFITAGSLVLVGANILIIRQQPTLFTATMGLGAASWLIGNILWLAGQPIYVFVLWWIGFPLFTVIGERLELSRILRLSKTSHLLFGIACAGFFVGAVISLFNINTGTRLAGLGEIACALWLLRFDIARRTVRKPGMPRFIALCLLSGYGWLGISGILNSWFGATYAGPYYDAALHTLFVGFVFSMIFGHALIILPAVLQVQTTFKTMLYAPLILLHLSLLLRIVGDLISQPTVRQWGGMLNVIALLLFIGSMVVTVIATRQRAKSDNSQQPIGLPQDQKQFPGNR